MEIDETLVRRLLAARAPDLAGLSIAAVPGGWDNRSFRLGDRLVARLPSAPRYAASAEKEQRVLPLLAPHLPLPIPRLVASFGADAPFARPWSVLQWIEGETAAGLNDAEQLALAEDLARFLRTLHGLDAAAGPAPGEHSFWRGGPLTTLDADMQWALPRLGPRTQAAAALWRAALSVPFVGRPHWLHGDLHPGNLLVRDGRLAAVIDWGLAATGDPAADLAIAWRWCGTDARRTFRAALPFDADSWTRGAAWAAWKAAIILAGQPGTDQTERGWAAATLDQLAADPDLPR